MFLSTLSLRRATSAPSITPAASRSFYPRSPCGERRCPCYVPHRIRLVSIHALLAESDDFRTLRVYYRSRFYPRSPCGERHQNARPDIRQRGFLSTLSLRRATLIFSCYYNTRIVSIHALLAESDLAFSFAFLYSTTVSIHALLAESDPRTGLTCGGGQNVSIHALLAESDANWFDLWGWAECFYPRSPCGERRELV